MNFSDIFAKPTVVQQQAPVNSQDDPKVMQPEDDDENYIVSAVFLN